VLYQPLRPVEWPLSAIKVQSLAVKSVWLVRATKIVVTAALTTLLLMLVGLVSRHSLGVVGNTPLK
jgi:hypothetical protein